MAMEKYGLPTLNLLYWKVWPNYILLSKENLNYQSLYQTNYLE
jgi:hypothetical protein